MGVVSMRRVLLLRAWGGCCSCLSDAEPTRFCFLLPFRRNPLAGGGFATAAAATAAAVARGSSASFGCCCCDCAPSALLATAASYLSAAEPAPPLVEGGFLFLPRFRATAAAVFAAPDLAATLDPAGAIRLLEAMLNRATDRRSRGLLPWAGAAPAVAANRRSAQ